MKMQSVRANSGRIGLGILGSVAVGSILVAGSAAIAGIEPPVLEMGVQIFSKADTSTPIFDETILPENTGPFGPPNNDAWGYDVNVFDPAFNITGEINASPTTSPVPAFLNPTLNFANNSTESLWFLISITMPVAHTFDLPLSWASSASWTLTGPNPELKTLEDTPLWSVSTDGNELGSLFPDETVMNNDNLNISDQMGGMLDNPVSDSMTINLAFKLSPNAVGGVNGNFVILPAPGALAMLGIAGLVGTTGRPRR